MFDPLGSSPPVCDVVALAWYTGVVANVVSDESPLALVIPIEKRWQHASN